MSSSSIGASIYSGSQTSSTSNEMGVGIDVAGLVQSSMANQTAELTLMQQQQTQLTNQQSALTSFNNDLQSLQTALNALTDPVSQLTALTAASSNSSILTASAISGAANSTHTITVNNLATTSSEYSTPLATSTAPLADGTMTIQVGSNTAANVSINNEAGTISVQGGSNTPVTTSINSSNPLSSLSQAINSANIGVTASVISDANGYRLAIVSNTSGAPGDLTITASSGLPTFTKGVTGVNASLTVDGVPISSTTNTVSTAIPGVTLNLNSANPNSPVTVAVAPDTTDASTAVNNFVNSYNTVVKDLNAQLTVDPATNQAGPLASDTTLSLGQSQILASASFSMTGNGAVNSLTDLGISFNNDGTMTVDNNALTNALQTNFSSVQSFFEATNSGSFGANFVNNMKTLADPITGSFASDLSGIEQTQTDLTSQITDFQNQMSVTQQALTAQYAQVNVTLQELPLLLDQVKQQLASLG
jgi:flagellar hook-associated protein 2